jgi:DNA-binding YbaB/EbfC family protein
MFAGGKKGMKDLMKQAQKMQRDLLKAQEEAANKIVEASAGGGMVSLQMNGKYEIKNLKIDPEAVDPEDVEMLEDLIIAAFTEAKDKIDKESENNLGKITGGMKIPGLF